jgi:hypothetical protein
VWQPGIGESFNHYNVLSSASVKKTAGGDELKLEGCHALTVRFSPSAWQSN